MKMIAEELIDRLDSEIGDRLSERGRDGRRRALAAIAEFRVLVTEDGSDTWEEVFDRPPTLGQLIGRVGPKAFVVSVAMRARAASRRTAQGLRIAAE